MNNAPTINPLVERLNEYKKKFYLNQLIKGTILGLAITLSAWVFISIWEYYAYLSPNFKTIIVFASLALGAVIAGVYFLFPIYKLLNMNKFLSNEEAAIQIGKYFPEIKDKLLNTLQLSAQGSKQGNELIAAAIAQRTKELSVIPFTKAVEIQKNRKLLPYLGIPIVVIIGILLFVPQLFSVSTARLANYSTVYVPEAPFKFVLLNQDLSTFKNEDYTIKLKLEGKSIPEEVNILLNGRPQLMRADSGVFSFEVQSVQGNMPFAFEAVGYQSENYELKTLQRPGLLGMNAEIIYPKYLNRSNEKLSNTGNFTIPQGSKIKWSVRAEETEGIFLNTLSNAKTYSFERKDEEDYELSLQFMQSTAYELKLKNGSGVNKEKIAYTIEVIPDGYPQISVEQFRDTTYFQFLSLGGTLADDYGLSKLELSYRITDKKGTDKPYRRQRLRLQGTQNAQSYLYNWRIDSLGLQPGQTLEYFLTIYDNDGVVGPKGTRSTIYNLAIPSAEGLQKDLEASAGKTEQAIAENTKKAQSLKKDLSKLKDKIKTKRNLGFQEKKQLEDLLKKREELAKEIAALQEKNKELMKKQERFNEGSQSDIKEKMEKLQELMKDLLDEETKKLYEELQRLLAEKNLDPDKLNKALENIERKEENLSKELDRSLEIFKQLQFEQKLNNTLDKLDKMAEEQEKLAEKTNELAEKQEQKANDKNDKANNEKTQKELGAKQDELSKQLDELKEQLKELKEMNEQLEEKQELPEDAEQDAKEAEEKQEEAEENLKKQNNKKAAKNQKEAAQKMQELSAKIKKQQEEEEEEEDGENAEALRQILENLLTLSFAQEEIMKEYRGLSQLDPKFVALGQRQLKLKDDAKIIDDSLTALAKRVPDIRTYVTREVSAMRGHLDDAIDGVKARRPELFAPKQQLSMTAMNNLALMLTESLKNMQESMRESKMQSQKQSKGKGKKGKKSGQGKGKGKPSLSQMQKGLNEKIQKLQKGNKQGRELSEELAKLAAEQEAIRRAMQKQMQGKPGGGSGSGKDGQNGNGQGGKNGQEGKENQLNKPNENESKTGNGSNAAKMMQEMEKTEQELVNKRLTQDMIRRQEEILSRLLESEKAQREREEDEKRESKTAKEMDNQLPPDFKAYLKAKQKQLELLQSSPLNLSLFYKQELSKFLERSKSNK